VRVEVVQTISELEGKADAWNKLTLNAPYQLPMLSHAWVASFLEHRLTHDQSWRCFFAYDDSELVGVLPVVIHPPRIVSAGRPKLIPPNDWHTISVDFLVEKGREKDAITSLLTALSQEVPDRFVLKLSRLPEESPTLATLSTRWNNTRIIREFDGLGSFIWLEKDFEHYQSILNAKFKRNLRSRTKSLYKLPGVEISLLKGSTDVDLMDSFIEIEASGRKGHGGAIALDPTLVSFYRSLSKRLADLGWLYWHVLKAEGKIIAVNMVFQMEQRYIVFKMCYDENYRKYSPGSILVYNLVEHVYNSSAVREIDFLSDLHWHDQWKMKKRRYYNLYFFPTHPRSLLCGYLPKKTQIFLRSVPGFLPVYHRLRRLLRKAP
jgi:CelD/BcsL family acetyltransferase involved in cellulose biosynthesis